MNTNEMQLQYLPSEIFFRIFSFLPTKHLVLHVARVCVLWNSFSLDDYLWKYNCLARWRHLKEKLEEPVTSDFSWLSYFKSKLDKKNLSFLILGAEGGGSKNERLLDVKNKITAEGIEKVDVMNVRTEIPTLENLRSYDAVMFFFLITDSSK